MAALALLRPLPLLRLRLNHHRVAAAILIPLRRPSHSFPADSTCSGSAESVSSSGPAAVTEALRVKEAAKYHRIDDPEYRKWKDKEEKILRDVEAITVLIKEILHSDRYVDGERLSVEDERAVVEKLLAYHPHAEDKIGCGLDSIMVDRHPQFRHSRCLFVVRTDGGWIDFSYQKCLRDYIRNKYPSHAERFIREHLKRGSG